MNRIAALAASLALLVPASALAQPSATCQAYNPQLCPSIGGQSTSNGAAGGTSSGGTPKASAANAGTGSLPFTGLDVALLAVGGGALVGTGLVIRRLSHRLD